MSKRKHRTRQPPTKRETETGQPVNSGAVTFAVLNSDAFADCCKSGKYIRLRDVPEIAAGLDRIASVLGSMTLHIIENGADGKDHRIIDELSRFVDIHPSRTMNRSTMIEYIAREMLIDGNAIIRPKTRSGYLQDLQVIPRWRFELLPDATGYDYAIRIDGKEYTRDKILHFVFNPDKNYPFIGRGLRIPLKALAECIVAADDLGKDFMESRYYPSVIITADGTIDGFQSKERRRELVKDFIDTDRAGEPWIIPADQLSVHEVRPMTLSDLAINDTAKLNLQKLAALLGVPAFCLGAGEFSKAEWNNFISTKIRQLANIIAAEMTRVLITSPQRYIRFNILSVYEFDVADRVNMMLAMSDRGYVNGNEVREAAGMLPGADESLEVYRVLENYIPAALSGEQNKLKDSGDE